MNGSEKAGPLTKKLLFYLIIEAIVCTLEENFYLHKKERKIFCNSVQKSSLLTFKLMFKCIFLQCLIQVIIFI